MRSAMIVESTLKNYYDGWGTEMSDKDKEAKERMKAWRALPVEGRISWEGFKRQWAMMSDEQRKAAK